MCLICFYSLPSFSFVTQIVLIIVKRNVSIDIFLLKKFIAKLINSNSFFKTLFKAWFSTCKKKLLSAIWCRCPDLSRKWHFLIPPLLHHMSPYVILISVYRCWTSEITISTYVRIYFYVHRHTYIKKPCW